jgi:hypothetical protein
MAHFLSLHPDQQEAMLLVAVVENSYKELASKARISLGAAKSRVHRGRKHLKSLYDDSSGFRPHLQLTHDEILAGTDAFLARIDKLIPDQTPLTPRERTPVAVVSR